MDPGDAVFLECSLYVCCATMCVRDCAGKTFAVDASSTVTCELGRSPCSECGGAVGCVAVVNASVVACYACESLEFK